MKNYKTYFKGKKITVMGLGLLGGIGDIIFLAQAGADLIVTDLKPSTELRPSLQKLRKFKNIKYTLGRHELADFRDRDLIIKAPTTPLDSVYIKEARKNKIPITMWAALFSTFAKQVGAKVIGVTGTRGKTTTTEMITHILKTAGKKVISGGNIRGTSILASLPKLTKDTIIVLELDSWKLQGFGEMQISPDISVFTTFFPDHMNYYRSNMQKYFEDKAYIFSAQNKKDFLFAGEQVLPIIKKWEKKSKFKIKSKIITPAATLPKGFTLSIIGQHNIYNASLAVEVARLLRIKDTYIKKSLKSFKGVPGRLEFIRSINGIKYYNDTTATTAEASVVALRALGENHNIILIAGGSDKGLSMTALVNEIPKYVKVTILLSGSGTDRIKKYIKNYIEVSDFKKAVQIARDFTQKGDVVLLSPAFASFGMFKNEYDRGDQFNSIVKKLR